MSSTSAPTPAAAAAASTAAVAGDSSSGTAAAAAAPAAPAGKKKHAAPEWTDEERAAKKAARQARLAQVQQIDEQVEPLYPGYPECRVLIYNVAKKANVGTVVRTAVAFGATQIIVVGNRKLNTLGNQATTRFISFRHFATWPECMAWVRSSSFKLVGIEIGARAKNVSTRPFSDKTIFVLGNEGAGMTQQTMDDCDEIVYIPQYGKGTASLNVATAAAIVLHHFAEWAHYPGHTEVDGAKFKVDEAAVRKSAGMQLLQREAAGAGAGAAGAGAAEDGSGAHGDEAAAAAAAAAAAVDGDDGGDDADDDADGDGGDE